MFFVKGSAGVVQKSTVCSKVETEMEKKELKCLGDRWDSFQEIKS